MSGAEKVKKEKERRGFCDKMGYHRNDAYHVHPVYVWKLEQGYGSEHVSDPV